MDGRMSSMSTALPIDLNAIKTNPMLVTVQNMLKKIYKHYHYSPKALRELKTMAESLEEKSIKPTNLSGTRWVPHISAAIKCLLKNHLVILSYLEHVSQSKATLEVVGRATFLAQKMKDYKVVTCFSWMTYSKL